MISDVKILIESNFNFFESLKNKTSSIWMFATAKCKHIIIKEMC